MVTFNILRGNEITGAVTAKDMRSALEKIKSERKDFREADSLLGNGFYLDAWYFEIKERG